MGNLNGFVQSFLTEVLAIGRAHVNALGGNALVSFKISECLLDANINKNQVLILVFCHINATAISIVII